MPGTANVPICADQRAKKPTLVFKAGAIDHLSVAVERLLTVGCDGMSQVTDDTSQPSVTAVTEDCRHVTAVRHRTIT